MMFTSCCCKTFRRDALISTGSNVQLTVLTCKSKTLSSSKFWVVTRSSNFWEVNLSKYHDQCYQNAINICCPEGHLKTSGKFGVLLDLSNKFRNKDLKMVKIIYFLGWDLFLFFILNIFVSYFSINTHTNTMKFNTGTHNINLSYKLFFYFILGT